MNQVSLSAETKTNRNEDLPVNTLVLKHGQDGTDDCNKMSEQPEGVMLTPVNLRRFVPRRAASNDSGSTTSTGSTNDDKTRRNDDGELTLLRGNALRSDDVQHTDNNLDNSQIQRHVRYEIQKRRLLLLPEDAIRSDDIQEMESVEAEIEITRKNDDESIPTSDQNDGSWDMSDIEIERQHLPNEHELEDQYHHKHRHSKRKRARDKTILALISNILLIIGSTLYLWMSIEDLLRAHEATNIPEYVLRSDDDAVWDNFQINEAVAEDRVGDDGLIYISGFHARLLVGVQQRLLQLSSTIVSSSSSLTTSVVELISFSSLSFPGSFQQEDQKRQLFSAWDTFSWIDLPGHIREAAMTLGHDEFTWNQGSTVFADELLWDELTSEQHEAIASLQYTQATWDEHVVDYVFQNAPQTNIYSITEGTEWSELPRYIQLAYFILGYTEDTWDNSGQISAKIPDWNELTRQQRQAINILRNSNKKWAELNMFSFSNDNGFGDSNDSNDDEDAGNSLLVGHGNDIIDSSTRDSDSHDNVNTDNTFGYNFAFGEHNANQSIIFWHNHQWYQLPGIVQSAARVIGYNESTWDNHEAVPITPLTWDELSDEHREAAFMLGYNHATWDYYHHGIEISEAGSEEGNEDNNYRAAVYTPSIWDEFKWYDLPVYVQNVASVLGFNQDLWDNNGKIFTDQFAWPELTTEQREAATFLGYKEETWRYDNTTKLQEENFLDHGNSTNSNATADSAWGNYSWLDLPDNVRDAAISLGYDENNWNNDNGTTFTGAFSWEQLTSDQRDAAIILGYSQETWHGRGDDHSSVVANYTTGSGGWDKYDWSDLPENVKGAAVVLGYDEFLWNRNQTVFIDNLSWTELTTDQQEAAIFLGYTQESWDGVDGADDVVENDSGDEDSTTFSNASPSTFPTTMVTGWADYDWSALPEDVKAAAVVLGYNELLWDTDGEGYTSSLFWADLTQAQREAATVLGWTEETWDDDKVDWSDYSWSALPHDVQAAAIVLGYNQQLWDADGEVNTDTLDWTELTQEQREAAAVFGWNQVTWDTDDDESDYGTSSVTITTTADWSNYYWSALSDEVKAAAAVLGYNGYLWDTDGEVSTNNLNWTELTQEQREAAAVLGWTQETWDNAHEDSDDGISSVTTTTVDWNNYDWSALPEDVKAAATILGYNEQLWDTDGEVYTHKMYWADLTQQQREAAAAFGWNQETWDADDDDDVDDDVDDDDDNGESDYSISSVTTTSVDWNHYYWSALPEDVKAAGAVLGYNEHLWDTDGKVYTDDLYWAELTQEQREAAAVFGWNQETWDTDDGWNNYHWSALPEDVKTAAVVLGYNEHLWDTHGEVYADNLYWAQLTEEQREAAAVLGWTQETWDGDDIDWNNYSWSALPGDVKAAAAVLGYTEQLWDTNGEVSTDGLDWTELTEEQREAAAVFGWTQGTWDGDDIDWDNYYWSALPEDVKAAAAVLGYNEQLWDTDGEAFTEDLYWAELTDDQREAAAVFGWGEKTWDGHFDDSEHGTASSVTTTIDWDNYYWSSLPEDIKSAAAVLGYDEHLWNSDGGVFTDDFYWAELTEEQRAAAAVFGLTQETWDADDGLNYSNRNDDDYVFQVGKSGTWVSRYQILYFVAALCFLYVGMLDYLRERKLFHGLMVFGAIFGLVSAMLVERSTRISNIFNTLSVHCYCLEALMIIRNRYDQYFPLESIYDRLAPVLYILWTADTLFLIGSVMYVILSYLYFDVESEWNVPIARLGVSAPTCWLTCSLIYLSATIQQCNQKSPLEQSSKSQ